MFDDLFNFSKKRTLKQSLGFYLFYAGAFVLISAVMGVDVSVALGIK